MRQVELPQSLVETLEAFASNLPSARLSDHDYVIEFAKSRPYSRIPIFIQWLESLQPGDLEYIHETRDVLLLPAFCEGTPLVRLTRHFFLGACTNVRRRVCDQTPQYDWGGLEVATSELALNILTTLLPPGPKHEPYAGDLKDGQTSKLAYDLVYRFRDQVLFGIPKHANGVFHDNLIKAWIEIHTGQRFWNFPENRSYQPQTPC